MAFEQSSPGFPERLDILFAQVATVLINLKRKKGTRPVTISDVVLKFRQKAPSRQPWKEIRMKLMNWAAIHNARVDRQEKAKQKREDRKKKKAAEAEQE